MAYASPSGSVSSLASTIDRNFLECSIYCEPFNDPRALPCLHAFCCGCLENWARKCSKRAPTVSCPLCKMVYQIPEEEGIKGFPAHFLVANLQTIVEKARKKSTDDSCASHGKKKEYYCEDCGCSTCSDCAVLDPNHRGHAFIPLKDASQRQIGSLEILSERVKNVEEQYEIAIQRAQQVEKDVDGREDAKIHNKEEKMNAIQRTKEKLQVDLTTIQNSRKLASDVVESGSYSDIASLYPSLSSSLQQVAQFRPSAVDATFREMQRQPRQVREQTSGDLSAVAHRPPSTVPSSTTNLASQAATRHQSSHLGSSEPASVNQSRSHSLPVTPVPAQHLPLQPPGGSSASVHQRKPAAGSQHVATEIAAKPMAQDGSHLSMSSKFNSESSIQLRKEWKECRKIKTSPQVVGPRGIAVNPNGDIAVTNEFAPVAVFSRNGDFRRELKSPRAIDDIAATPYNQYIVPGKGDSNEFYIYDNQGVLLRTVPTYNINNKPSTPTSVAVDSTGRIIVGLGYVFNAKTVSIHQADGTLISMFETTSSPWRLTCTPDDRLIIAFTDNTLQVMDQYGHDPTIIQPPTDIQSCHDTHDSWVPEYICCSKTDELFVSMMNTWRNSSAVYRYVATGGEYKYLDCITEEGSHHGIALSADGRNLYVVDGVSGSIRVFK